MWLAPREHRVRRQHPIGSYVADFACPGCKLAIELDGGQHAQQEEEGAARTLEIAPRGYSVVRFWNNEVMHNLAGVLEVIRQELGDREGEVGAVGALQSPPQTRIASQMAMR